MDIDTFSYKPTPLNSSTLEKIRQVLDYRCMVSGSEQKFLLGLGVSAENDPGVLLVHFNATILPCSFIPSFPVLKDQKGSPSAVPETERRYFMFLSPDFTAVHTN